MSIMRLLPFILILFMWDATRAVAAQPTKVRISYSSRSNSVTPLAATSRMLQENPTLVKRTLRAMLKAHNFVFENKRETMQIMMRWLEQSPEVAERSYELAGVSWSRDGEITDPDWEKLIEKLRPLDEVRDFRLLREAQKELKTR